MRLTLAGLVIIVTLALVIGGLTGRVRARNCCALPADQDRRLQAWQLPGRRTAGHSPFRACTAWVVHHGHPRRIRTKPTGC